jgi:hypothetical protein
MRRLLPVRDVLLERSGPHCKRLDGATIILQRLGHNGCVASSAMRTIVGMESGVSAGEQAGVTSSILIPVLQPIRSHRWAID